MLMLVRSAAALASMRPALESVEESGAAVSKPRCVRLRVPVVQKLKEACRLPVHVQGVSGGFIDPTY